MCQCGRRQGTAADKRTVNGIFVELTTLRNVYLPAEKKRGSEQTRGRASGAGHISQHAVVVCVIILNMLLTWPASQGSHLSHANGMNGPLEHQSQHINHGANESVEASVLEYWGVPPGARVLLEFRNSCGAVPPTAMGPNVALLCNHNLKVRECMNISSTGPFLTGRNCKGRSCVLALDKHGSACFLEHYGVSVDTANATRRGTCGLDLEDASWLKRMQDPTTLPLYGTPRCASAVPRGAKSFIWLDCVNGGPVLKTEITFNKPLSSGSYGCVLSPVCAEGFEYVSQLLCYDETGTGKTPGKAEKGRRGRSRYLRLLRL